jgi:hypothetical protein
MSKSKGKGLTLSEALGQVTDRPAAVKAVAPPPEPKPKAAAQPSRQGTKTISGHFAAAVSKQLKQLALDLDSNVQELLREAVNDLFRKHGKPPLA